MFGPFCVNVYGKVASRLECVTWKWLTAGFLPTLYIHVGGKGPARVGQIFSFSCSVTVARTTYRKSYLCIRREWNRRQRTISTTPTPRSTSIPDIRSTLITIPSTRAGVTIVT